jgi:hypothetical protein
MKEKIRYYKMTNDLSPTSRIRTFPFYLFLFFYFILCICACSKPVLIIPTQLPSIVKQYKHVVINAGMKGMKDTGIYLAEGDLFSIFANGTIDFCPRGGCLYRNARPSGSLIVRVGDHAYYHHSGFGNTQISNFIGKLYIGYQEGDMTAKGYPRNPEYYTDDRGFFNVSIIIWKKQDYDQILTFLKKVKDKDYKNNTLDYAIELIEAEKSIYTASKAAAEEIDETQKQLAQLKQDETASQATPVAEEKITELEAKLAKLQETLAQLELMKKQLDEERQKTIVLTQELEEKEIKEQELVGKLKQEGKAPPVIVIASPREEGKVEVNIIRLTGVAEDDKGLQELSIFINGKPIEKITGRGIKITSGPLPKRLDFDQAVTLEKGINELKIRAVDSEGLVAEKTIIVHKEESRKNVWAVVIGINAYSQAPHLKYALNDAKAFHQYLIKENGIPAENVTLLLDQEATLAKLRSVLGTQIKNKAGKDDMVILYFAGHGATEKDVTSLDGDGLEKYLLPFDADPKDLYASALPMREISHIFNRIRAERLVFIVDSCYSGAGGGRTIAFSDMRANISETFLERIVQGRGTILLSASGANEVSAEDDKLKHGIFTYFLLEGLSGKADTDGDGVITVDEIYAYVSKLVPQATGQEQHPVKKGAVEGSLILGLVP